MTRSFPASDLTYLIRSCDDDVPDTDTKYKFVEADETTEIAPKSDRLGVWCDLYFEVEGVVYWCRYIDGCQYWKDNSGERWDNHFESGAYGDALVPCIAVESKKTVVTTYKWVPVSG